MLKKTNKDAQHYNSCPFMAMELTKLKYLNDKEKRENLSLPVLPSTLLPNRQVYRLIPLWHSFLFSPPPYRHYYKKKKVHILPISHSISASSLPLKQKGKLKSLFSSIAGGPKLNEEYRHIKIQLVKD